MTKIILFPERNISDSESEMTYSFKLDSLSLEEAVYLYKDSDSNKVMCFPNELENGELISVDMLSDKEVHSEIKVMSIYGEILEYGWRDVLNKGMALICKEGAFIWDQVAEEFILVGKIRWSMTVRKSEDSKKIFLVKLKKYRNIL
ncbi:MAG: hypothetical protein LRY71_03790 [Bacillaceae bacterium]|nr:hypothetical protein [Bacillaceae bacterium]